MTHQIHTLKLFVERNDVCEVREICKIIIKCRICLSFTEVNLFGDNLANAVRFYIKKTPFIKLTNFIDFSLKFKIVDRDRETLYQ